MIKRHCDKCDKIINESEMFYRAILLKARPEQTIEVCRECAKQYTLAELLPVRNRF